jgi:hypothetical protein
MPYSGDAFILICAGTQGKAPDLRDLIRDRITVDSGINTSRQAFSQISSTLGALRATTVMVGNGANTPLHVYRRENCTLVVGVEPNAMNC